MQQPWEEEQLTIVPELKKISVESASSKKRKLENEELDMEKKVFLVINKLIGEGVYGKVYQTIRACDKSLKALKIFKTSNDFSYDMVSIIRELLVGGSCSLLRTEVLKFPKCSKLKLEEDYYGIVSELGHCNLEQVLPLGIPIHAVRILGRSILEKINFIHESGFMHRDLKPENILLTWKNPEEKEDYFWPLIDIIDYGLSAPTHKLIDENVVTLWWRAPEVMENAMHSKNVDIWSFGIIIANMCSYEKIIMASTTKDALQIIQQKISSPEKVCTLKSHEAVADVIKGCLQIDPEKRLHANELLELPFWYEHPTKIDELRAMEWIQLQKYRFHNSPVLNASVESKSTISSGQVDIFTDDEQCFVRSERIWMRNAFKAMKEEHFQMARVLSVQLKWSSKALESCIFIMDRSLNSSIFVPFTLSTLACCSAFITTCLFSNVEPCLSSIKEACKCQESEASIKSGVHAILRSMQFRAISQKYINHVKQTSKLWKKFAQL